MASDHPASLWSYALDRYARPGAEALCLGLQDNHGWDVCELLWVAWLSERGLTPASPMPPPTVRQWQRDITRPLRQRRRALKAEATTRPRLALLRQTLKQAELLAEREALDRLAELPTRPQNDATPALDRALALCDRLQPDAADAYPVLRELLARWIELPSCAEPKCE